MEEKTKKKQNKKLIMKEIPKLIVQYMRKYQIEAYLFFIFHRHSLGPNSYKILDQHCR